MLEFFQQNYQRKLMMNSENKSILFSSQSFYPGIGGVSTLLLNLSKYLSNLNYKLYAIPLALKRKSILLNSFLISFTSPSICLELDISSLYLD